MSQLCSLHVNFYSTKMKLWTSVFFLVLDNRRQQSWTRHFCKNLELQIRTSGWPVNLCTSILCMKVSCIQEMNWIVSQSISLKYHSMEMITSECFSCHEQKWKLLNAKSSVLGTWTLSLGWVGCNIIECLWVYSYIDKIYVIASNCVVNSSIKGKPLFNILGNNNKVRYLLLYNKNDTLFVFISIPV